MSFCPRRFDGYAYGPLTERLTRGIGDKLESMTPKKKQKTSNVRCDDEDETATSTERVNDSATDWRDKYKHVRDMHIHALENKYLADIIFIVGEEKVSFSAHRIILALGSPVFEAMFYGGLAEKGDSVSIPDVDPKGFDCLLRFLYCGDVVFDDDVIASKTFFAADKYCVMSLKDQCESYLTKCKLKASNVWVLLESSLFLNSQNIKDRCLAFLRLSTKAALEDNSFLGVTSKTVETFLSLDALSISEMRLLPYLIRWAEHKSQSELNPDDSFYNFYNYFMPLLKLVRFSNLTEQDFVQCLEIPKLKNVLSDHDALYILKHLLNPSLCSLPYWCCKEKRYSYLPGYFSNALPENEKPGNSQSQNLGNKKKGKKLQKIKIRNMLASSSGSSDTDTETISSSSLFHPSPLYTWSSDDIESINE